MSHVNQEKTWEAKFHECLALEFSSPEYFNVHHLLVTTYMIQTDGYSAEVFPIAVALLEKFLTQGADPRKIIAEFNSHLNGLHLRNQGIRNIHRFPWKKTIMDVRADNADQYCADVRSWAKEVWHQIADL